jgi:hypothetical protein
LLETPNENLFPHANDSTIEKLINKQLQSIESEFSKDVSVSKTRYFTTGITTHSFRRYAINKMESLRIGLIQGLDLREIKQKYITLRVLT